MFKNWKLYLILILGFHLLFLIQLKFTAWPEMLLWPYLLIKGQLPYENIAMAHTPLMVVDLAIFFKIFGVGVLQLKIFTWILILILDLVVFWVSRKLWNTKTAVISVLAFVLWMTFFDGNGLWFDLYMGLFALTTFYFVRRNEWLLVGVSWAIAIISKQTAVWFLIPVVLEMINSKRSKVKGNFVKFIFGSASVFLFFIILLFIFQLMPYFYNWAINFGVFILPRSVGQIQLPDIKNLIVSLFPFTIFLPLLLNSKQGLVGAISDRSKLMYLVVWVCAGIMGAYPRFEYFHFQPGITFLALGTGLFFANYDKKNIFIKTFLSIYIFGSIYLFFSFTIRNYGEGVRFYENEVEEIVLYVKNHTKANDKIFILNWWDNIYPLTDTIPATNLWVPQLSWYQESGGVQEEEVSDLISTKPKIILLQGYSENGLSSYKPQKIYEYVISNYVVKETINGIQILTPKN